jgi:hypothetical protein
MPATRDRLVTVSEKPLEPWEGRESLLPEGGYTYASRRIRLVA